MRTTTSIPRIYADQNGLKHHELTEKLIGIFYRFRGQTIGEFRADLVVDEKVIVELKTGRDVEPAWEKQLLNYLRATQIKVGMLFNFGPSAQFKRHVFENERKNPRKFARICGKEVLRLQL